MTTVIEDDRRSITPVLYTKVLPTDYINLVQLCNKDLTWDTFTLKVFILILWVKISIDEKSGHFLSTKEIFIKYEKFFKLINQQVILPETTFYKEIYSALLAAKIIYAKSRQEGKKGIRGIQFKNSM